MLALLSNQGSSSSPQWTVNSAGYQANEDLVDVVSCTKVTADSSGGVSTTASGGAPIVLVPASSLNKTGSVCASLATGTGSSNQSSGAVSVSSTWKQWTSVATALGAIAFIAKVMA